MTPSTKPTTRLTSGYVRERGMRQVVATLHGSLLILRPKGCRQEETLDIASLWYQAIKARVLRERAEKRAKRKKGTR